MEIDQFILNNIIHGDGKNYSTIKSDYYSKSKGACSRCSLIVNFKELGFTHILYPLEVDIGLCNGHCKDLKSLSEHAKLLFLSKTETPGKSTCCYANTYNDISIYFQKGDNYYTKLIERIVIDTCQCS
uniref:TGF_BETA_2 domain-containing protein n=1 Tax=Strongyloides papillosus TaxID=174720 RepID=A0A0N5CDQ9_STREA